MTTECIVPQSAGSLSVAVLALLMTIFQVIVFFRKPQFAWYAWGASISLSGMAYAIGIFLEYNTPLGTINRFGGLLEFTAIICLVHCLYGFAFAHLGINGRLYHAIAGIFHAFILVLLWSSNYIVADRFVTRNFIGLAAPFNEADLGPLGPMFVIYAVLASIGAIILWVVYKAPDRRYKVPYLAAMVFWVALGIHDGVASMGVPTLQYFMEYGFFGYSLVLLWVVFSSFVDVSAEDRYRVITESANDGILVIQDGKTVFGNPASGALIGWPVKDSAAKDFLDVVVPEDRQKLSQYYKGLLRSEAIPGSLMIRVSGPGREEKIAEIRGSVILYRNRPAVLAVMRDVTERIREHEALKESEEKLARLKKMESLGLLAGGVAHDLNNVLSGIVGYPELILSELSAESNLRKPIETMQESGKRAVAIVEDLLTVARGAAISKEPLNLNDVVMSYLETPEYTKLLQYHPTVKVKVDLDPNLFNIKGSPVHIGKAVMNLVSNACEAIDGLGNVVVSTMNSYIDRPIKGYEDVNVGEYAVLAVTDDGPGISSEDLKRIFEPFYTKKKMGRSGTGLGLTLVWNVIQDHEGYIDVKCGDRGTEFMLYFPITRDAVVQKTSSVRVEDLYGRGETILVVDDVKSQREISSYMLAKLGYKAESVSGGDEAIEYLKKHSVDLLLLDMIMDPGIDGLETYKEIKKIYPGQKAVIVSGFAETEQVKEAQKLGAGRFVKKPIILEHLGMAVKEALEKGITRGQHCEAAK
jgi:PAS domain S-box-containing protein